MTSCEAGAETGAAFDRLAAGMGSSSPKSSSNSSIHSSSIDNNSIHNSSIHVSKNSSSVISGHSGNDMPMSINRDDGGCDQLVSGGMVHTSALHPPQPAQQLQARAQAMVAAHAIAEGSLYSRSGVGAVAAAEALISRRGGEGIDSLDGSACGLQDINVRGNKLCDENADGILRLLPTSTQYMDMSYNSLLLSAPSVCRSMLAVMSFPHSLRLLQLERNNIGNAGANMLANGLPSAVQLHTLVLTRNTIGDEGEEAVCGCRASPLRAPWHTWYFGFSRNILKYCVRYSSCAAILCAQQCVPIVTCNPYLNLSGFMYPHHALASVVRLR
jgi:hypothetical protein